VLGGDLDGGVSDVVIEVWGRWYEGCERWVTRLWGDMVIGGYYTSCRGLGLRSTTYQMLRHLVRGRGLGDKYLLHSSVPFFRSIT
jgi:hypothetical protein